MPRLRGTLVITSLTVKNCGSRPVAETVLDPGMIVANNRSSDDPPADIVAPSVENRGEIVIDVVGLPTVLFRASESISSHNRSTVAGAVSLAQTPRPATWAYHLHTPARHRQGASPAPGPCHEL
jgi:hypothetical protein